MKIFLAPIQGFTDYVFRNAHYQVYGGVSKYFTPFIRVESGAIRNKDITDLIGSADFGNPGVELVPQVIASTKEEMYLLLEFVRDAGFGSCDINFGCPFPQQSKKYRGCGILRSPEKVQEVLGCARDFPEISFSIKMRLGYDNAEESMAVAGIINSAPLRFVTIHPRLGKQMYSGDVDMDAFRKLKSAIKHPVAYNGDVVSVEKIKELEAEFPDLEAVMIGRGLIGKPFLAKDYIDGTLEFDRSKFLAFLNLLIDGYREHFGNQELMVLDKVKTFAEYFAFDKKSLKKIQKSRSVAEFVAHSAIALLNG